MFHCQWVNAYSYTTITRDISVQSTIKPQGIFKSGRYKSTVYLCELQKIQSLQQLLSMLANQVKIQ